MEHCRKLLTISMLLHPARRGHEAAVQIPQLLGQITHSFIVRKEFRDKREIRAGFLRPVQIIDRTAGSAERTS